MDAKKTCQFLSKQFSSDKEVSIIMYREVCMYMIRDAFSACGTWQLLGAIASALGVYYNSTGQSKCYSLEQAATSNLGDRGWSFQVQTYSS